MRPLQMKTAITANARICGRDQPRQMMFGNACWRQTGSVTLRWTCAVRFSGLAATHLLRGAHWQPGRLCRYQPPCARRQRHM